MLDLIFETAHAHELEEVSRVICSSWKYAYKGLISQDYLNKLTHENWMKNLAEGLDNDTATIICARHNGQMIGVSVTRNSMIEGYPDDLELVSIYFVPEYIGAGAGNLLMARIIDLAKNGYSHIILDVLSENTRAINFYKKHRFMTIGNGIEVTLDDKNYFCDLMRLELLQAKENN